MEKLENTSVSSVFWTDDQNVLPSQFLGLRQPDGGFFLTNSDLLKDPTPRLFQDPEDIQRLGGVVYRYELDQVLAQAKSFMKTKNFKNLATVEDIDHAVVFWHIDDERSFVVLASTDRNTDLTDAGLTWLGETHQSYADRIDGVGVINPIPSDLSSLRALTPKTSKLK